jgi:hypothetical protein
VFAEALTKWDDYCTRTLSKDESPELWALSGEVSARLEQLDIVLDYLEVAVRRREELADGGGSAREHFRAWDEIVLFSEAFYFVAWRLYDVLRRKGDHKFPGMRGLKVNGITAVRNQLIEHPEHTSKLFTPSFGLTDEGLVIKGLRTISDETRRTVSTPENIDHGLLANATELRDAIIDRLDRVLRSE